ncbi:hypothetical protein PGTUg99_000229 [Puccinia graminis f. sp. tritici]|uniref:Uncharacterized protein n=1 Tax=Puccinia graminis f. sp. tritici TaxID=56615 RepID=A0A5B0N9S6_PUCGR|nr:hypothetical protein PGTUg99_000229 [Puccinia graminis f. sp. tritici]
MGCFGSLLASLVGSKADNGAKLKQTPKPVSIEITWPKPSNDTPEDTLHPQRIEVPLTTPPIDNDAPLDIPLAPRFDRRLAASIHAPHNRPRDPLPISSDSDSDSSHNPIPISPDSNSDSTYKHTRSVSINHIT